MVIDVDTLQAFIVFAYKKLRYELAEHLLMLMEFFEDDSQYKLEKRPPLMVVD